MRYYWGLILIAIFMAFGTGYYALFLQGSYIATSEDIRKIRIYKQEFLDKNQPRVTFNLRDYYPYVEQLALIKPPLTLRASSRGADFYSTRSNCMTTLPFMFDLGNFTKSRIWEEYRCGERNNLPSQFFTSPPYMHPSGKSFMYLAYKLDPNRFGEWSWLDSRIYFFHIEEIFELMEDWPEFSSTPLAPIISMGIDMIYKISQKKSPLVHDDYLYLKRSQQFFANDNLTYDLFALDDLKKSLRKTEFTVDKREHGEKCFFINQDLCWSYNLRYVFSIASEGSLLFFAFSMFVIIWALWLFFNKLKAQRLEDERRRLALQVLSHEFRTPVASLLLNSESLLNSLDDLNEQNQNDVLRISSDVHRLHRLVELSRYYLKINQGKRLVDLNRVQHNSFFELVQELLIRYEDDIEIKTQGEDSSVYVDEYWLGICLKNLVENALKHGSQPVKVTACTDTSHFIIEIQDSGNLDPQKDLNHLTQEFVKGDKSEGSGLGLNIVIKIVDEMKAKLELTHSPTTFKLKIPKVKIKEKR